VLWRGTSFLDRLRIHINLPPHLPKLLAHLDHAGLRRHLRALIQLRRVVAHVARMISIEQNFGQHFEQKCATLCASFGSVSSYMTKAEIEPISQQVRVRI